LIGAVDSRTLFASAPVVHFEPEERDCPRCGASLKVTYTHLRRVKTLHLGTLRAHETVLHCPRCRQGPVHSEQLTALAPPGANLGYDVMIHAGTARLRHHRSEADVVAELAGHNVALSPGAVRELTARFVTYLGIAHLEAAPAIAAHLALNGGYILHLDSTSRRGSRKLMAAIDEISGFVLLGVKLGSETAEDVAGFLRRVIARYGPPLALAADMAAAIRAGKGLVEELDGVPLYVCHFHFLRDAGKDLMQADYRAFQRRLDSYELDAKLVRFARRLEGDLSTDSAKVDDVLDRLDVDGDDHSAALQLPDLPPETMAALLVESARKAQRQGDGYGMPFDRPKLAEYVHLLQVRRALRILRDHGPLTKGQRRLVERLCRPFEAIGKDRELLAMATGLHRHAHSFDQLRQCLRLAPPGSGLGLNHPGLTPHQDIATAEAEVRAFRDALDTDQPGLLKLREQLDRHWDGLFRPPIRVAAPDGRERLIHPQRTNNILEQFFRAINHGERRRSGTELSAARFDAILPDSLLGRNLDDPDYVRIILDGDQTLAQRFSRIDQALVRQSIREARTAKSAFSKPRKACNVLRQRNTPIRLAISMLEHQIQGPKGQLASP